MGYLTIYIIVGFIFIMVIEGLGNSLKVEPKFENKERIAISIFWPLAFLVFIITLIVEIIRHRR